MWVYGYGWHMRALVWHDKRDVRVDTVPDPVIEAPTDAIIRVTSTGLCGSDLHLYEVLGPFLEAGDILGHEPMGIVEAVGPSVHWTDQILPLLVDDDPLDVDSFVTHHLPLEDAPDAYEMIQKKEDGMIKAMFHP